MNTGNERLTKWHYTTGRAFVQIVQDGFIRQAVAFVPKGERPIVWFSTNPDWEPTANKAVITEDGSFVRLNRDETEEIGQGLVRFGVAEETAPYCWHDLRELSGMSAKEAQRLYREGIRQGARPGQWWGTFDSVPRHLWIYVQVFHKGTWVDVPFDRMVAA